MSKTRSSRLIFQALALLAAGTLFGTRPVSAQSAAFYTGEIQWIEAWRNGNAAFTLSASGVPCNGQFILNKSDDGTKNLYAMLVAAKAAARPVRVYFVGCGPAEGSPSSNYAQLNYLYLD